jgi:D-tyrosyl-tRNA(Tyr) deacylase
VTLLFVLAEPDPVARGVGERWGHLPTASMSVGGDRVRELGPARWVLRRAARHFEDEALSADLRSSLGDTAVTVVFPSIHRSESGPTCFTVHPLGNPTPRAEVGGQPERLTPTDPVQMTAALRAAHELASRFGKPATFESTHHGPLLDRPAFFIEIGGGPSPERPDRAEVEALADTLRTFQPEGGNRTAMGIGGGHYAPHFTELALSRRWNFGHLFARHVLPGLSRSTAEEAVRQTPGCEGAIFARAADAGQAPWGDWIRRLRDADAPRRSGSTPGPSTSAGT